MEEETCFEAPPSQYMREPHRVIKQETRLPVIPESSPPRKTSQPMSLKRNSVKNDSSLHVKGTDSGSSESSPFHEIDILNVQHGNYSNVSLDDEEELGFEMLWGFIYWMKALNWMVEDILNIFAPLYEISRKVNNAWSY